MALRASCFVFSFLNGMVTDGVRLDKVVSKHRYSISVVATLHLQQHLGNG